MASITPPRLSPVPRDQRTPEMLELLAQVRRPAPPPGREQGDFPNLFTTLVRHPRLFAGWLDIGGVLAFQHELPDRDKELLTLRTVWLCHCEYVLQLHSGLALNVGITKEEIAHLSSSEPGSSWSEKDTALLHACDELIGSQHVISNETWAILAQHYTEHQLIEVPITVGHFVELAFALNSFGVPLENPGQ